MNQVIPQISDQIYKEDTIAIFEKAYSAIGPVWMNHQIEWMNNVYSAFKDHDKFLIIIYLTKKTLDFYSRNFTKLSYDQFYEKDTIEIEKFNIVEISINLNIPKESARRKILELEKNGIIKKFKKKIIIDRSAFKFIKPIKSVVRMSRFLSLLSEMLVKEKILKKKFSSTELEKTIKDNFTYVWKVYYELQIPMLIKYNEVFEDLENFHIFGTCVQNQHLNQNDLTVTVNRIKFLRSNLLDVRMQGLNAMSISDITGIPRATVVRKLKKLVKKNFLAINEKKHYTLTKNLIKKLMPVQKKILDQLADFSTKVYNLTKL
jgi:DNA-binding Lrp family transcriptional regulator